LTTNSSAIATAKKRWERAELWLEIASVAGGLMVGVGLWIEGESTIGQRLVTGGVAMEVICAWWVLIASRKLQNILETEFGELRLKATEAELRLEQLRRQVSARRIDESAFLKALDGTPTGNAEIVFPRDDGEAWWLATQLYGLLRQARWNVAFPRPLVPTGRMPPSIAAQIPLTMEVGAQPTGITIVGKQIPGFDAPIKQAFLASGFGISGGTNEMLPDGILLIVVGPKP
jgi:hypothetical protein